MNSKNITLFIIAGLIIGCGGNADYSKRPAEYPRELIVLDSAYQVDFYEENGRPCVAYKIDEDYPAEDVMDSIAAQFHANGWKQYTVQGAPPTGQRDWSEMGRALPEGNVMVRITGNAWEKENGDIVVFQLEYVSPEGGTPNSSTLDVKAYYESIDMQNPDRYSSSLVVLPNAQDVRYANQYGRDDVYYTLKIDYPADDALNRIMTRLQELGWTPNEEDFLNPGTQNSHVGGWSEFGDLTTGQPQMVRQWMGNWEKDGAIVTYTLKYSHITGAEQLMVSAMYWPADKIVEIRQNLGKEDDN